MKIYFVNDTSAYHAGCRAAVTALKRTITSGGHEIVHTTVRPLPPDMEAIRECDAMVLSGEGSLHEEAKRFHDGRAGKLLRGLAEAKRLGKKAYLVNCLWYHMESHWHDVLASLDGLAVREISSQEEMERTQGVKPEMYIDASYFCQIDSSKGSEKFAGRDVVGTFYYRNMKKDEAFTHKHSMFKGMIHLGLGGEAAEQELSYRRRRINEKLRFGVKCPTRRVDWSYVVNSLKHANLYVTGQHHGVYAACRARTPFVIFKVNTHKISGLFKWAGVDIPIAETRQESAEAIEWARTHGEVYERFFDWMEQQPAWPGI